MFDDNIVVNNVYKKIKEIEVLDSNQYKEINLFYLAEIAVGSAIFLSALLIFNTITINQLIVISAIIFLGLSLTLFLAIRKARVEFKNNLAASKEVKAEIYDYISKPHVQKELVKFFELTFNYKTIDELKKLFALKEHIAAYFYIDKIIQRFLELENQKNEQMRSKELLHAYEQKLKKTSRAKLRLVQ